MWENIFKKYFRVIFQSSLSLLQCDKYDIWLKINFLYFLSLYHRYNYYNKITDSEILAERSQNDRVLIWYLFYFLLCYGTSKNECATLVHQPSIYITSERFQERKNSCARRRGRSVTCREHTITRSADRLCTVARLPIMALVLPIRNHI